MGLFSRKKKQEAVPIPTEHLPESALPEEFERFRIKEEPFPQHKIFEEKQIEEPFPKAEEKGEDILAKLENQPVQPQPRIESSDKIELILQKLETIDARLKLIEERLKH